MKATLSKDGVLRFSVTVPYRIGRDVLIAWLCRQITIQAEYRNKEGRVKIDSDVSAKIQTRSRFLRNLRVTLHANGIDSIWYWADDIDKDSVSEIRDLAERFVDATFPELTTNPQTTEKENL